MQQPSPTPTAPPQANPKGRLGRGFRALFLSAALLALLLPLCMGLWLWHYANTPLPQLTDRQIEVVITPASDFIAIQNILVARGIMAEDSRFRLLARLGGKAHRLKAGEYRFVAGHTPNDILEMMAEGRVLLRQVTIPEGANLTEIAAILKENGWSNAEAFLALAKEPSLRLQLGIAADSLEGYLFPDTYSMTHGQSPQTLITMMVNRLDHILAELYPPQQETPQARPSPTTQPNRFANLPPVTSHGVTLSPHQLLTLASIVEKETALAEERPQIAGVFLNRLRTGMRLQADPTVIYGIPNFSGNLTRKDLLTNTPYNTYTIRGLPPGPIANPGRDAIAAVLNFFPGKSGNAPSFGPHYYFVATNDGGHYFSKSLSEHNRAVRKYQKRRPGR